MWAEGGFPKIVGQLALGIPTDGLVGVKGAACLWRKPDLGFAGGQADAMPTDGELIEAANKGEADEVRRLIAVGAKIDESNSVREGGGSALARRVMRRRRFGLYDSDGWCAGGWSRIAFQRREEW